MTTTPPTNEPAQLRAGDTWKWTRHFDDYPASAGWTLKYRFKNATVGFEIVASASGDDYAVSVVAATTAAYAKGAYTWMAWVENAGGEKYSLDAGNLDVLPDYRAASAATALDDRAHARKVLDAIEAVIEGRASLDQMEYQIQGRMLKRTPLSDLMKFRNLYRQEVKAAQNLERLANGLAPRSRIMTRF